MKTHLIRLSIACVAVALIAAILGTKPASAGDKEHIVLCTVDDLTGFLQPMAAPKHYAYQIAVKEINDAGGIMVDGKKKTIKLIQYDGQSKVKRYQELAQTCIFEHEADVLMAGYIGSQREAARREAVRNNTIYWLNSQVDGGIADHYSFFSGPTPEQQVVPSIKWMIDKFGPRIAFIGADYNFCRGMGAWVRTAANLHGGEMVMDEYFPFEVSQWQSTIDKIQKLKPDFQAHCLVGAEQVQYYPQAQAAGLDVPTWSNVTIEDGFEHMRFAPPSLKDMYVIPWAIEDSPHPNAKVFSDKLREVYPDYVYMNEQAATGYTAVKAMARAWEKAGTTEVEAVIDALESGIEVPEAPGGPWRMNGATHHAEMNIYLFHIDAEHNLTLLEDLGMQASTFLTDMGIDLRVEAPGRQYTPFDNPEWKSFFE